MVLILVILVLPGRVTTPTNAKVTPRISCLRAEGGWDVVCISGVPGDEWSVLLPVCAALGDVRLWYMWRLWWYMWGFVMDKG